MSTAKTRAAHQALSTIAEALTLARQAARHTGDSWTFEEPTQTLEESGVTIWTQAVIGATARHLSLLCTFVRDASYFAINGQVDKLEAHVRAGVPTWSDTSEAVLKAEEAWRRGDHIKLGRKRG